MPNRDLMTSTELTGEPADGDATMIVDVSDPTDAATGTTKKYLWSSLKALFVRVDNFRQRVMTANVTLANGECWILSGYLNLATFTLTLNGDSRLEIL